MVGALSRVPLRAVDLEQRLQKIRRPPVFTGESERRFRKNLRRLVCESGLEFSGFGEALSVRGWAPTQHAAARKVRRIYRGDTRLTLNDLETFADTLGITPAVLAYGTVKDLEAATRVRHRHRPPPRG
jgi:hypothetical protein